MELTAPLRLHVLAPIVRLVQDLVAIPQIALVPTAIKQIAQDLTVIAQIALVPTAIKQTQIVLSQIVRQNAMEVIVNPPNLSVNYI
jgi:hypothetical protein